MKNHFSKVKIACFILCLILTSMTFIGCNSYKGYKGENPELFSVAINSLLSTKGYFTQDIHYRDPQIKILEEDDYGRVLFAYCEDSVVSTLSLLIIQKTYEQFVYFYPDYNFISVGKIGLAENVFNNNIVLSFSDQDIQNLKERNDWSLEIDESKCVKVEITRKKVDPIFRINKETFETLFKKIAKDIGYKGNDALFRFSTYCTSDNYGRMLYYGYGVGRDVKGDGVKKDSVVRDFNFILIFNPDASYNEETCIMELADLYNYQDQLKAFKELNNWNLPL